MLHLDAVLHGLQLPAHNVRVVFHLRHQHLVARLHLALAERARHQVDGLGGAACEDYLLCLGSMNKPSHRFASRFVQVGSLLTQVVHAAVHVSVHVQVFVAHGIEHAERFLRCCRIVQIHQWASVHLARQNGEVAPYFLYVVHLYFLNCAAKVRKSEYKTKQKIPFFDFALPSESTFDAVKGTKKKCMKPC